MSIPKEPRQLMINIMYLVLTALLALNVSAEIFNAFEMVDEGLTTANASLDEANSAKPDMIREAAKKKASLSVYADKLPELRDHSKQASAYIDGIVNQLIDASGDNSGSVDDGDYVMVLDKRELKGRIGLILLLVICLWVLQCLSSLNLRMISKLLKLRC